MVLRVGYRLIRSLVICWLRERTNAEKYTERQTNKACEGTLGHQVEGNDVTVSSEDSQNEARATGFSVMNSRRAMELLARFTLKIHNRLSLSNCKPLNNKLLCQ